MSINNRSTDARDLLAFVHLRKCAGTTLLSILRSNYLFAHLDIKPAVNVPKAFVDARDLRFALCVNPFVRSIAGHKVSPAGRLDTFTPNVRYISILRDPKARYLSDYVYHIEAEKKPLSPEQWLKMDRFKNYQTRAITGTSDAGAAIEFVERQMWLVGVTEAFDEFLLLLKKKLEIPAFDIRYRPRRVASERVPSREAREVDWEKYEDAIYENNRADYELYSHVNRVVLPRQREWYGTELHRDLAAFKEQLAAYRPHAFKDGVCWLYRNLYCRPLWKLSRLLS